jgi:two-component system, LytTR family, sensor kinase
MRAWLRIWAGWTALALFFAISTSLSYRSTGRSANWSLTVTRSLSEWWLWALLTPIVVRLATRFPVQGRRRWAHLALHAALGAVFAVFVMIADRITFAWLTGFWTYLLASTVALQFFVYGALVTLAHGMEFYHRSREREQIEARLAETRLQLLGMQLQPHFLFNTLNTIAELVHHDPDTADRMIADLSDLLRRSLDLGAVQEIPLHAELDLLERYLDIQRARFGDRLRVEVSVDPSASDALVPVLLLQPIVENAIRHGIAAHARAGVIRVAAARRDGDLDITVIDDGPGLEDAPGSGLGLGLRNTRERLETLYGSRAKVELSPAPGGGTRASLLIPIRTSGAAV